jgi:hypothetical protein
MTSRQSSLGFASEGVVPGAVAAAGGGVEGDAGCWASVSEPDPAVGGVVGSVAFDTDEPAVPVAVSTVSGTVFRRGAVVSGSSRGAAAASVRVSAGVVRGSATRDCW